MIQFTDAESLAEVLEDNSAIAHFANKAEEAAYEQLDSRLIEQIRITTEALHLSEGVYQIEDWWPNHLRGIESSPQYFRRDLLDRLRGLLAGDFVPWRIVIHYYEGPSNEDRGSALILSDRILATHSLRGLLK
jgi:hypothetical protein